jgi:nitric oxide reductase activation protein
MISSLGFGNENVFQYMETDSYKKANLHISIDASGSMGGSKWANTLTNVVALCKAVDMIQNLSIQVSFRTTHGNSPYVVMAYDSRIDKFSKVKQMFPALRAGGTTPEGLCFEAIMKNFLGSNNDMDSYFLNISDGEPYFEGGSFRYSGEPAFEHTRKMVKQIEGMGIKTLSYFVDEWSNTTEPSRGFKKMYGKGAKKIDVTNVAQITKTINELFLTK